MLRGLPATVAQPYAFGEFQRRARARAHAAHSLPGGPLLAAAAVVVLAVVALTLRLHPHPPVAVPSLASTAPVIHPSAAPLRAKMMERWLASLPSEPAVVQVGTRSVVTGLEDRIAQVDDLLSAAGTQRNQPPHLVALQQERTRLLATLVQVRFAENLADESR